MDEEDAADGIASEKLWSDSLDERTRQHVSFCISYARDFGHGAPDGVPDHLSMLTIAKLAEMLDTKHAQ